MPSSFFAELVSFYSLAAGLAAFDNGLPLWNLKWSCKQKDVTPMIPKKMWVSDQATAQSPASVTARKSCMQNPTSENPDVGLSHHTIYTEIAFVGC